MSSPAQNAFLGKTTRPSDSDLEKALGRAKPLWDYLVAELGSEHDVTTREWKSYSAKNGWSLRLNRGKRTIVWLAPCAGLFQMLFIFGEKALTAIRQTAVPARVRRMLEEAPTYPEGTGLRFQDGEGHRCSEETGGDQAAELTRGRRHALAVLAPKASVTGRVSWWSRNDVGDTWVRDFVKRKPS